MYELAATCSEATLSGTGRGTVTNVKSVTLSLGSEASDFERRLALQQKVLASVRRFSARDRLSRDEAHRRRAVR